MSDHHTRHADKGAQTLKSGCAPPDHRRHLGVRLRRPARGHGLRGAVRLQRCPLRPGLPGAPSFLARNGLNDGGSLPAAPGVFTLRGLGGGLVAGLVLFTGASFQQVAMIYTTAGNAGFITGLYVILVPIIGIFLGHGTHAGTWIGAVLATAGLFLLSVTSSFTTSRPLVLIGAFFWACHVHIIGWLSPRGDALKISFLQYAACSVLSMAVSLFMEVNTLQAYLAATVPILFGGIMSVGVAYTLQVIAQKKAAPPRGHHEPGGRVRGPGGWIMLGEFLTDRGMAGAP